MDLREQDEVQGQEAGVGAERWEESLMTPAGRVRMRGRRRRDPGGSSI